VFRIDHNVLVPIPNVKKNFTRAENRFAGAFASSGSGPKTGAAPAHIDVILFGSGSPRLPVTKKVFFYHIFSVLLNGLQET
jgi:hypothetical protein